MSRNHSALAEYEYDEDAVILDSEEELDEDPTSDYVPSDDDEPQLPRRHPIQPQAPMAVRQGLLTAQVQNLASMGLEEDEDDDDDFMPDADIDVYSDISEEPEIVEGDIPNPENARGIPLQIPQDFPSTILQVLMLMPFAEGIDEQKKLRNLQIVIDFVQDNFSLVVQRDIAALLTLAPQQIQREIAYMVAEMMDWVWADRTTGFLLSDLLGYLDSQHSPALYEWLVGLPNEEIAAVLSRPATKQQLLHLPTHVRIFARADARTGVEVTECPGKLYTPPRSMAEVVAFIKSLTIVNMDCLAEDEVCGICRGSYVETYLESVSDEGEPRELPCGHVFNSDCIRTLLAPKPHGWQYLLCPVCRAFIQFPGDKAYNILE